MEQKLTASQRRKRRVRQHIKRNNKGRLVRLSVFRSSRHIYAQLIDDGKGVTIASASSLEKDLGAKGSDVKSASLIGIEIAKRAKKAGIEKVIFDRGNHLYHGRVKALAESAREEGLQF